LARDALRAMSSLGLEPAVHLVEASPALREIQQHAVPHAIWHHDLASVPEDGPLLLAANEFLDALPVRQLVKTEQGWRERMVVPHGEAFACIAGDRPMDAAVPSERRDAPPGAILETSPAAAAVVQEVAERLAVQQGAALFVDYGYAAPQFGSSLQAVRAHRKVDPFADPGEADLTAHVDFGALAEIARASGARWLGTMPQGAWLSALGIDARTEALSRSAPHLQEDIRIARERLVAEAQMGTLFKAMGLAHADWPDAAGFPPAD
jgi:NADH dehydrogenase [ubiquinone] 1 alpha subcomplex assembly factor 7